MPIEDVVIINISLDPPPIEAAVFKLMVAGQNVAFTERIRWYSSAAELLADTEAAITSTDYEYLALAAIFSQTVHPDQVGVGRCDTAFVAQVDDWSIDVAAAGTWTLTINGVDYTYIAGGGDTATVIRDGLVAAAAAAPDVTVSPVAANALDVTADVAGVPFTSDVTAPAGGDASFKPLASTDSLGWPEELGEVFAEDDSPYYVCIEDRDPEQVYVVATYIETLHKLYIGQTSQADVKTSATTDVASLLQDGNYFRTGLLWYSTDATTAAEAWAGKVAAANPDAVTTIWALKNLVGVTADALTTTEQGYIKGKYASFYDTVGGVGATWEGRTPNGKWIDNVITVDWLYFRLREDIWRWYLSVSNRNEKINYDDDGIKAHRALTKNRLEKGFKVSHINSNYTVTVPLRADVDDADVNARRLTWSFAAEFAGAIQSAVISGNVVTTLPA
jgi:hypothetical protein